MQLGKKQKKVRNPKRIIVNPKPAEETTGIPVEIPVQVPVKAPVKVEHELTKKAS